MEWAQRRAKELGLRFKATPAEIKGMIKSGQAVSGDIFFDYCVPENKMSRPDDPLEGVSLENECRELGITLVFMDRTMDPIKKGQRREISEAIVAIVDNDQSGKDRIELAEKSICAQLSLVRMGFSTGGRPPYGSYRALVRVDGEFVRELEEGEVLRRHGHHVVWLPGPESKLAVIREILEKVEHTPAGRVARYLNEKGVPAPDAGRIRKDLGVTHLVTGTWNANTIKNIATNPLLRAVTSYGKRSMGDLRRMTPEGPRLLEENDYRPDGEPKVIRNDEGQLVTGTARFEPLITAEKAERIASILKKRAGSQRDKPRSQEPEKNPLGARIFDANCGWPMYREPYLNSFRYVCAKYHQTKPRKCDHNCADGITAAKLALAVIRQKLLPPGMRSRLESKLREGIAAATRSEKADGEVVVRQSELAELRLQMTRAERNAAPAESAEMFQGIQRIHGELKLREQQLQRDLATLQVQSNSLANPDATIQAALALVERLPSLANDPDSLESIGELFCIVNAELFLNFHKVQKRKRIENKVLSGIFTLGDAPSPIVKYKGPTGRRALQQIADYQCKNPESLSPSGSVFQTDSGRKAKSSGNGNRAGGI